MTLTRDFIVSVVSTFLEVFSVGFIEIFIGVVLLLVDVIFFVCTMGFSKDFDVSSVVVVVSDGYFVDEMGGGFEKQRVGKRKYSTRPR